MGKSSEGNCRHDSRWPRDMHPVVTCYQNHKTIRPASPLCSANRLPRILFAFLPISPFRPRKSFLLYRIFCCFLFGSSVFLSLFQPDGKSDFWVSLSAVCLDFPQELSKKCGGMAATTEISVQWRGHLQEGYRTQIRKKETKLV